MSHGGVPAPERIVLVGFMAAGKTTTGRLLAAKLRWRFVDFDALIEERTGRTPAVLIREHGEGRLRREEARLTEELAGCRRTVLAPGGGWITQPELVARLGAGGLVVWLRISVKEAVRRAETQLAAGVDRPLLGPVEGRLERSTALLRGREPFYASADLVVDVEGKEATVVAEEILRRMDRGTGGP